MLMRPHAGIDVEPIVADHLGGGHEFAFFRRKLAVGHRRQPDIGVEPDLMAGMAGEHGPAARLRHVADEESAPADFFGFFGEAFEESDQLGMSPVAIARQPHDLPGRAVDRQREGAGEAT